MNSTFWMGKRCLVTGGMGFGGSHLCEQLLGRGARVYVLDRMRPRNSYLVLKGLADQVEFIEGDVRNLELVKFALERFEVNTVFHLAAQPIVPVSNSLPYETLSINASGTYSVLEAVRTSSYTSALIFASSGAYYGLTTQQCSIPEDQSPGRAGNIYAPSKVAGDIAVRCYAATFGMKAACCRFMNTYGPGNTNFTTIVPKALTLLLHNELYDFGPRDDGTTMFDYLHIRDMTNAYLKVAESLDKVSGEAFNFSGGRPISVRDLVKLISKLYDGKEREPQFHGPRREVPVCKYLDTTKARTVLGWQPSISLEEGLAETMVWYRDNWSRL